MIQYAKRLKLTLLTQLKLRRTIVGQWSKWTTTKPLIPVPTIQFWMKILKYKLSIKVCLKRHPVATLPEWLPGNALKLSSIQIISNNSRKLLSCNKLFARVWKILRKMFNNELRSILCQRWPPYTLWRTNHLRNSPITQKIRPKLSHGSCNLANYVSKHHRPPVSRLACRLTSVRFQIHLRNEWNLASTQVKPQVISVKEVRNY